MWCLWSAKGGSGCSVMAASAALNTSRREPVLLVDLAGGDLATVFGLEPERARTAFPDDRHPDVGLAQWLLHPSPPPDALARMERTVVDELTLLPFGGRPESVDQVDPSACTDDQPDRDERLTLLAHVLAADSRRVIVDLGRQPSYCARWGLGRSHPFLVSATRSTLVTRLCYLGVRAALDLPRPDDVIAVIEPERALGVNDVSTALGVSTVACVRWDPAIARAVDAGLLARRLPRPLQRLAADR